MFLDFVMFSLFVVLVANDLVGLFSDQPVENFGLCACTNTFHLQFYSLL